MSGWGGADISSASARRLAWALRWTVPVPKAALISAPGGAAGAAPPVLLRCVIFKLAIRRMAMQCDFMNWASEIVTLEAIPTRVGDGWRILIEWVGGRIQYISWFDTLQDAEDWIENNARSWVSSARNRL